jgi:uncharacterized protein (TIGR02996 family)
MNAPSKTPRRTARNRKAALATNPDLEAAIARSPLDPAGYRVLADWLEQQGDPRGGWINLHLTLEEAPWDEAAQHERDAMREQHAALLVPDLGEQAVLDQRVNQQKKEQKKALRRWKIAAPLSELPWPDLLRWRHGFVEAAEVIETPGRPKFEDRLRSLLDHPMTRQLRGLSLVFTRRGNIDLKARLADVLRDSPQAITRLFITAPPDTELDVDPIGELFPHLRALGILALPRGKLVLPKLEYLDVRARLYGDQPAQLAASELPGLRVLRLNPRLPIPVLLRAVPDIAPNLTELRLRMVRNEGGFSSTQIVDVLRAPWLQRLRVLEIVGLIDHERTFLEEHRETWNHLEELRVGQFRFGEFTSLESVPNVRVLHPIEGAQEPEPLDWVTHAPEATSASLGSW